MRECGCCSTSIDLEEYWNYVAQLGKCPRQEKPADVRGRVPPSLLIPSLLAKSDGLAALPAAPKK
eukprot:5787208-Amphidinium_carterae.1